MRYKQLRNRVKYQIKFAKRQYFADGAKHGGKFFWDNIKSCSGIGKCQKKLLPWPARNSEQAKTSANNINQFFITSVNNITSQMPQNTTPITTDKLACSYDQFAFNSITGTDVIKCIRNFPTNKASGYDNISMLMIKKSATHIVPVLTKILNRSLQSGIFPACWKNAIVYPVYKKGEIWLITDQ